MDFYPNSARPHYPRVTEIISVTDKPEDKERLRKWQHKMNSLAKEKGTPSAETISQDARDKGTVFHEAIRAYFLTEIEPSFSGEQRTRWQCALPHLKRIKGDCLCLEQEVYSDKLCYIGHLDCLAWRDDRLAIVDWKTSGRFKKRAWIDNYFIQGAAYAIAAFECGIAPQLPDEIEIYVMSPTRTQVFVESVAAIGPLWIQRLNQFKALSATKFQEVA